MRAHTVFKSLFVALLAFSPANAAAQGLTHVPTANTKVLGVARPNVLSVELAEVIRAQGSMALENPQEWAAFYGYNNDQPQRPFLPPLGSNVEAMKTEPDKNTYLVLQGQRGADPSYDYGTHFLFQGHEAGNGGKGYITRINLDADVGHRVTLMANRDVLGNPLPVFDGSTWYPWAHRLLFTKEADNAGGVWQATLDVPSIVEDVSGVFGRGGYEGIQADSDGNLWIVEDVGGTTVNNARQPNSFIYRFVPYDRSDLKAGGKLQVLTVKSKAHAGDIVFNGTPAVDILSQDVRDLHTYGLVFDTRWITIYDTAVSGTTTPFDANALAKGKGTPFKRPENGMFRPGTHFGEFYFTETGDTNADSVAGRDFGGFGGLFKVSQRRPSDDTGSLTLFFLGDLAHTAFDNLAFLTEDLLVAVEDRGDSLHGQAQAGSVLDSGWLFDVRLDYSKSPNQPIRILAQGRDASATIDSGLLGTQGFQNDGDNEITGIHVSDGDPTPRGILGAKKPRPFQGKWRVFYTQQHGDNITYEIIADPAAFTSDDRDGDDRDHGDHHRSDRH